MLTGSSILKIQQPCNGHARLLQSWLKTPILPTFNLLILIGCGVGWGRFSWLHDRFMISRAVSCNPPETSLAKIRWSVAILNPALAPIDLVSFFATFFIAQHCNWLCLRALKNWNATRSARVQNQLLSACTQQTAADPVLLSGRVVRLFPHPPSFLFPRGKN